MICSITQPGISYVYDYAGNTDNIVKETRTSGSYAGETTYAYDTLGQLTRVNDPVENATWVYTYDRGGNILNKKRYAYTTGTVGTVQQTISYTYNSAWKDKLATYNGITLTHDAGGNLTNDGTWTYSWQAGRELLKMEKTGTKIVYDYDHNGMRICKTVAGVATDYTVSGKRVTHLVKGSDWMHFFYDGQGRPAIVNYNGATYHYLYNLQGDVVGLIDTSGNIVVEYKYDAWGKIIARTGSLASTLGYLNPFRYRGYVYDEETGLYYLRSRYYNPVWGRFINADVLLGKRGALLSHNLFAYCANNPVIFKDSHGYAMVCCFDENGNIHTVMSQAMNGGGGGYNGFVGGYMVIDTMRHMDKEDWAREAKLVIAIGLAIWGPAKIMAGAKLLGKAFLNEAVSYGAGRMIGRFLQGAAYAGGVGLSGIVELVASGISKEEYEPQSPYVVIEGLASEVNPVSVPSALKFLYTYVDASLGDAINWRSIANKICGKEFVDRVVNFFSTK